MKWTNEELHELNQMIDKQIGILFGNTVTFLKDNPFTEHEDYKKIVDKFLSSAVKNYDLLQTIRVKVNQNEETR